MNKIISRKISGCIDRQKNEPEIWRGKFLKVSLKTGVLIQKKLRSIVRCISTYNNSLKLSTHAIVIIFIVQEIVSRNQVRFTFFWKKQSLKKSKTAKLKIEKNQNRTIKLMPNPSASSNSFLNVFKNFWTCSIFLNVVKYFWPCSNIQNYKVKYHFWPCSKIFDQVQKILNKVKTFWTWSKYFSTSRWNRHMRICTFNILHALFQWSWRHE